MTYKKLLVIFIIGILFVGIGAGVCVMEFGSYKYMGVKTIEGGAEHETTDSFDIELKGKNNDVVLTCEGNIRPVSKFDENITLVEDNSLPDNKIRVDVTYDGLYCNASVYNSYDFDFGDLPLKYDSETGEPFYYDENTGKYYSDDEMADILLFKNEICINIYSRTASPFDYMKPAMEDLKHKEIYNYNTRTNVKIKVYGSADTLSRIKY